MIYCDNEAEGLLLSEYLNGKPYHVILQSDLYGALDALRRNRVNCVVVDLLTRFEYGSIIGALSVYSDCPIVVLTAMPGIKEAIEEAVAFAVLIKPVMKKDFVSAVVGALRKPEEV